MKNSRRLPSPSNRDCVQTATGRARSKIFVTYLGRQQLGLTGKITMGINSTFSPGRDRIGTGLRHTREERHCELLKDFKDKK